MANSKAETKTISFKSHPLVFSDVPKVSVDTLFRAATWDDITHTVSGDIEGIGPFEHVPYIDLGTAIMLIAKDSVTILTKKTEATKAELKETV